MTEIAAADIEVLADVAVAARGRLGGWMPGRHRGRNPGAGGSFAGYASLIDHPDARRIDLRASLRDPVGTVLVRRFRQDVAAAMYILVDRSGSMAISGRADRPALAALIAGGLARAAERSGDRVGLLMAGATIRDGGILPAVRRRGIGVEIAAAVAAAEPAGAGISGLIAAAELIPPRRAVVFIVSDFSFSPEILDALLGALAVHDVRPIRLVDGAVDAPLPAFGLVELFDLEQRRRRLVLMRPKLAAAFRAAAAAHAAAVDAVFSRHDTAPIDIVDQLDADAFFEALVLGGPG
ncbi:DUF58 domain-containing protein [Methylobrevis albus]|uniref:DUF58 domain-containing protein n=1 Tax=Methylobrevis albus TaxID=2793297 RepID=A0A931MZL7_9HYPH|nr:DUF58 domain-containing protein [Methylobrevis albus]MBH0237881.1 DUF58 domain-containing protein [Methylobrevis albus]